MIPQTFLIKAVYYVRTAIPRIVAWMKNLGWRKLAIGAVVVILVLGAVIFFTRSKAPSATVATSTKTVAVQSVAELSALSTPLSVVGQVTSKSEATVRAERSGQVTSVNTALGNKITAGAVAAEIENASERAAVLQAEGAVDAAQANFSKVTGGARSEQRAILEANVTSATAALEASKFTALNEILSAYAAVDSAVHGTIDTMFANPGEKDSTFTVLPAGSPLLDEVESMRNMIESNLEREASTSLALTASSDLSAELSLAQSDVRTIRTFADMVITALHRVISDTSAMQSTIATYLSESTAARTSLTSALASLSSAVQGIASSQAALDVARKNLEQGVAGGQPEDVAAAKASLKQAQGSLAAARANLEKTIIRAPISGTINSFSLKRGDYVQAASPVLTVANNGALEVVAYISEGDAGELAIGQRATLDDATGVVTRIAPALDPITKKIEVRIGVDDAKSLINGQSVLVSIDRVHATTGDTSKITLPLSAIKVESDRTVVFTLDSGNILVAHVVELGALLGDRVVINSGISLEDRIVVDARGLREGGQVEVSTQGGSSSGGQ